ncbi:MAG TPA: oligoendopeptidase F, partial [Hyphomicrobium zavarzinii]|nr:oligoendopeptidase F [Hyphomicrobium zavarzinii]
MTPTTRAPLFSDIARAKAQSGSTPTEERDLGPIPEWDLSDLYKGMDDPSVTRDIDRAAAEAKRIKDAYQGKLVALAGDGAKLADAISSYEQLSDL